MLKRSSLKAMPLTLCLLCPLLFANDIVTAENDVMTTENHVVTPELVTTQTGTPETADACHGISLAQSRFAMAIADRTPIGQAPTSIPTDHDAVFFFNDIRNGKNQTMLHRWYYQNELVSEVSLAIGGDRWRTWSRKRLGQRRSGDWKIEVVTRDGCVLDTQSLPASIALPVLTEARSLLSQNDLIGARLLVKEMMPEYIAYRSRLENFLNEELALAQAKASIDEGQLYIADARLTQLESIGTLDSKMKEQLGETRNTLEARRQQMNTQTALSLSAFQQTQQRSLNGGDCPSSETQIAQKISILPNNDTLIISAWAQKEHQVEVSLIDQRTGFLHALILDCPNLSPPAL